jgi:Fe2+ or Zn2+ uptake regulation protein
MRPRKKAGSRITGRRRAAVGRTTSNDVEILRVLRSAKSPMSAYAILDAVRNTRITAPTTVYRALSRLIADGRSSAGITQRVRRVQRSTASSRFKCLRDLS